MLNTLKDFAKEIRHRLINISNNSNLGEEKIIRKYLKFIRPANRYCIDIAASDGMTQSNTLFLYKQNWGGLAVEYDPGRFSILANHYKKFPKVDLVREKVTPLNVLSLLDSSMTPANFDFFNLDIDSYDYFVLDQVLSKYRPQLICTEINEKIPYPIEFSVKYSTDHYWRGDHFYGQSISQLNKLCKKYNYKIVELFYNNAFLMPSEIKGPRTLTCEEAYKAGYSDKADRIAKFPYNQDMEELQSLNKSQGIQFLRDKFKKYSGSYTLR